MTCEINGCHLSCVVAKAVGRKQQHHDSLSALLLQKREMMRGASSMPNNHELHLPKEMGFAHRQLSASRGEQVSFSQ